MKKLLILLLILSLLFLIILDIILIRAVSSRQIDDVSPGINCSEDLLKKADILYIIPKFEGKSIADDKEFCEKILALNKTRALHGVTHEYKEFKQDRNESYLQEGIDIFKQCFNSTPEKFKAPQLAISRNNKDLIESITSSDGKFEIKLDGYFNQIFHKVYHCDDTGLFSNRIIDLI